MALEVILARPNIHQTLKKPVDLNEMCQRSINDNLPAADHAMARPAQARGVRRTFIIWGGRSRSRAVPGHVVSSFPELEQAHRGGGAVASRVSEIGTGVGKLRDLLACH